LRFSSYSPKCLEDVSLLKKSLWDRSIIQNRIQTPIHIKVKTLQWRVSSTRLAAVITGACRFLAGPPSRLPTSG
jgi:hypothetical protein